MVVTLTKVQAFMLFSLGLCHQQFEERFRGKPVGIVISKADFIDLVQRAGIVHKQDRAVYKNLQDLEEQRFVSYQHKTLSLTKKGVMEFSRISRDIAPYIDVHGILHSDDILTFSARKQTVLR
jgi:hypothetical protein